MLSDDGAGWRSCSRFNRLKEARFKEAQLFVAPHPL